MAKAYPLITAEWEMEPAILDVSKGPQDNVEVIIHLKGITCLELFTLTDYARQGLPLKIFAQAEEGT